MKCGIGEILVLRRGGRACGRGREGQVLRWFLAHRLRGDAWRGRIAKAPWTHDDDGASVPVLEGPDTLFLVLEHARPLKRRRRVARSKPGNPSSATQRSLRSYDRNRRRARHPARPFRCYPGSRRRVALNLPIDRRPRQASTSCHRPGPLERL